MKINFLTLIFLIFVASMLVFFAFALIRPRNDAYCNTTIENEKIIFAYSDNCPHCRKMEPIMKMRDDVYWLNIGSSNCRKVAEGLKLNINFIPTFICTRNASVFTVGEQSEGEITSWIERNC